MRTTGWAVINTLGRQIVTALAIAIYGFLYLPIVVLIAYSFSEGRLMSFPIQGFTLDWYAVLWRDTDMWHSITNSAVVAIMVVPLSLFLGVLAAFALDRFEFIGKVVFERIIMLPLIIPGVITGLSILLVLKKADVPLSLFTVVLGHAVAWMPIVVTQVYARLRRFDRSLEYASMDLGANRFQTFFRVTLPSIRSAIIGSALLVFTLSFDEIAITFFLTGSKNTLPMHIWSMMREGVTPEINAVATCVVVVSFGAVLLNALLNGRGESTSPEMTTEQQRP